MSWPPAVMPFGSEVVYLRGGQQPAVVLDTRTTVDVADVWVNAVRRLYLRDVFDADEMDGLLDAAVRGERPDHPDLPEAAWQTMLR